MSERSFYEDRAKREARAAVEGIEAQTSAEIVICLRGSSDHYRDADYLFGFVVSLAALVTMLYAEHTFVIGAFPLGVVAGFLAGAVASAHVAQIRRLLVFPARKLAAVRLCARGAFHDQGVSRTRHRTGILLYISMFERRIEVLPDVGIEAAHLGPDWKAAVAALESSLTPSPDLDRFLSAVKALGPHPRPLAPPRTTTTSTSSPTRSSEPAPAQGPRRGALRPPRRVPGPLRGLGVGPARRRASRSAGGAGAGAAAAAGAAEAEAAGAATVAAPSTSSSSSSSSPSSTPPSASPSTSWCWGSLWSPTRQVGQKRASWSTGNAGSLRDGRRRAGRVPHPPLPRDPSRPAELGHPQRPRLLPRPLRGLPLRPLRRRPGGPRQEPARPARRLPRAGRQAEPGPARRPFHGPHPGGPHGRHRRPSATSRSRATGRARSP